MQPSKDVGSLPHAPTPANFPSPLGVYPMPSLMPSLTPADNEAVRRMKGGDIGGLEILVRRYQVRAVRAAFLVTQDEPLAEDVVQDAFIHLHQRIHHFDDRRPLEPYLMRSVINPPWSPLLAPRYARSAARGGLRGDDPSASLRSLQTAKGGMLRESRPSEASRTQ